MDKIQTFAIKAVENISKYEKMVAKRIANGALENAEAVAENLETYESFLKAAREHALRAIPLMHP